MHEEAELLELTKSIAVKAGAILLDKTKEETNDFVFSKDLKKEIKASADKILEKYILSKLTPIGLPILSEESGYMDSDIDSEYFFILDPLDGTFNFVKDLGPSAISIALWKNKKPIFGVIYELQNQQLFWGGKKFNSYCNNNLIQVSEVNINEQATVCTGFPVRFNFKSTTAIQDFFKIINSYAKVRMLGSAAISLIAVSKGSSEIYTEKKIMLWDIAAGLAIIEGAGGIYHINETSEKWSYNVVATNGHFDIK